MAAAMAVAAVVGAVLSLEFSDRIAPGVTIGNVPVGGLPLKEARAALDAWSRAAREHNVALVYGTRSWMLRPSEVGLVARLNEALSRAYSIGRTGPFYKRWPAKLFPTGDRRIAVTWDLDRQATQRLLSHISRQVNRPYRDARLSLVDGRLSVTPDQPGLRLNVERVIADLTSGRALLAGQLSLPVEEDPARVSTDDLRWVDTQLSSFTTRFPAWRRGRTHNLKLAASSVNGTLIRPGEIFSYNAIVGPRLPKTGFKMAQVYVNGQIEEGVGGGVCQVSSTLYNAFLLAGLQIVARANHSMPVPYVPAGRDATVAYGSVDLKVRNNLTHPVYLFTSVSGNRLTAAVYGSSEDKRTVRVYTSARRAVPIGYTTVSIPDASAPGGKKTVQRPKAFGYSVTVYRRFELDGKSVEEVVSRDRYRPMAKKPEARPGAKPSSKPKQQRKPVSEPTPEPMPEPVPEPLPDPESLDADAGV